MARAFNPFYQDQNTVAPDPAIPAFDLGGAPAQQVSYRDPTQAIGSNLITALFGNPAMAAKQRQLQAEQAAREAQAEEARAHAQLYRGQAAGVDTTNAANTGLPDLIASLSKTTPAVPARAPMGNESDDAGEIPGVPGVTAEQAFKTGLPAVIASLVQGGHGANVGNVTQALAAFGGGDELARRGLVSDGHTPGKDFALTPERADQIAAIDNAAKFNLGTAVARTNHATDIPVANIRANASRDVAVTNNRDDVAVAQIGATSRVDAAGVRGGSNSLGAMIGSMYPGARLTSGDRSQSQQDGLIARGATGAVHSYHVPGNGGTAVDMAPIPGKSLAQVVSELRANGADVIEAKNETAPGQGTGPHWHIAVRDTGKPGAWAKAPPHVSPAAITYLGGELDQRLANENHTIPNDVRDLVRARAAQIYQQTGNPVGAVTQAIAERRAFVAKSKGAAPPSAKPSAPAAPKVEQWGRDANGKLKRLS